MAAKQTSNRTDSFYDQLRLALNNFHDRQWLGENSPLAAPYFLGTTLETTSEAHTALGRGEILQQEIKRAAETLWPGKLPPGKDAFVTAVNEGRRQEGNKSVLYYYLLLELRYFRSYFKANRYPAVSKEQDIREYLGVGRGPYYVHLKAAREALGEALLNRIYPTFRLEQPSPTTNDLVGREQLIHQSLATLNNRQTISLSGAGGMGKTSLGAAIAERWPTKSVFWFTVRPTFNDQLSSLLFSLGHFLHQQGASNLWLQLVADGGKVDNFNLALELVRGDLHLLQHQPPLFCFDEVDRLYSTDSDRMGKAQIQICEFLDSLHTLAPVLLIGQQHGLKATTYHELKGLSLAQTVAFLKQTGLAVDPSDAHQLHNYTGGNPRLLQLCTTLYKRQKSVTQIVADVSGHPALQTLFERIWQRLNGSERQLLLHLAVFRSPMPVDAWATEQDLLENLTQQYLAQPGSPGSVSLVPAIRDLIYHDRQRFSAEFREQCHMEAALIRATRGEYTAAAYHYFQAGEHNKAVQVWFPHRHQEVSRGQASSALAIFQQMSSRRLGQEEQEALALLRSELYQLSGEPDKGQAELKAVNWSPDQEMTTEAHLLWGDFLNALGYPQAALETYDEGIMIITRLLNRLIRLRHQRGIIHTQQRQMKQAWQEVRLAQYEAENLQGLVQEEQGHYEEAYLYYQRALALAKSIGYDAGVARTNRDLAIMLGRQARLEEAAAHAQQAIEYYQRTGDKLNQEKARNTLAAMYFQAGQFEKAIGAAQVALIFFEGAKLPYWAATTAATLAEAYFEVGNLEQAETMAQKVLQIDEAQSHPYALYTLSLIQRARQNLTEAASLCQDAIQKAQKNEDPYVEAYIWRGLGEILWHQQQHDAGQEALNRALQVFEKLGMEQEIQKTKVAMSELIVT